jgi:hypothetical protein
MKTCVFFVFFTTSDTPKIHLSNTLFNLGVSEVPEVVKKKASKLPLPYCPSRTLFSFLKK